MASSVVLKGGPFHPFISSANLQSRHDVLQPKKQVLFSSNLLPFSKLSISSQPAMANDVFSRFPSSISRRTLCSAKNEETDYDEVLFIKEAITPRSFKREDVEHVYLYLDMPGITKEDIEVTVDLERFYKYNLKLKIIAKVWNRDSLCESRNYKSSFDLPRYIYKTSDIKAKIKKGVLKVTLPKLNEVNQEDAFEELEVKVD